jgi:hypothetical protein
MLVGGLIRGLSFCGEGGALIFSWWLANEGPGCPTLCISRETGVAPSGAQTPWLAASLSPHGPSYSYADPPGLKGLAYARYFSRCITLCRRGLHGDLGFSGWGLRYNIERSMCEEMRVE